ncbi:MAG: ABC transporter substrate-binding protein [Burkholderiales bacterium]
MLRHIQVIAFFLCSTVVPPAHSAETLKIGVIAQLSGAFALQGEESAKQFRGMADLVNARGGLYDGRRIEIVGLDGKGSPQDSLVALNQAIDRDIRYVVSQQSNVVHALNDAVSKHNARNPGRRILMMTSDARDPAITEDKCNFWNFRVHYHADTELNFVTDYLAKQQSVRKVYLMNQDYAFGHVISKSSRALLARKRDDIQIVGDDLVPLGKVKDFAPYAAKIKASGADTVITGNWGNDLYMLVKAGRDFGLDVRYYIFVGNLAGAVPALSVAGDDRVFSTLPWHINAETNPHEKFNREFREKYRSGLNFDYIMAHRAVYVLAQGIDKARSDDPLKVAYALEGHAFEGPEGKMWIRTDDHQIVAPVYLAKLTKAGSAGVKYDVEETGMGWKTVSKVDSSGAIPEMKCKMERPPK